MRRDAPRIGAEVLLLGMSLAALGAALALLIQAQERAAVKKPANVQAVAPAEKRPDPTPVRVLPTPEPIDLTPERLRPIEALIAKEKERIAAENRRAAGLLEAANLALDAARQTRAEEIRLREEVASGEARASLAEDQNDQFARERDILAEKRDEARSTLERQRLRARDGVAVLPYKGPNGTWRRPIAIECRGNTATLQPGGPAFSINDMSSFSNPRRSPLVYAVAKAMLRAKSTRTPDGAASVPYLMFVVRPDGIRPYYAARTLLEPLGITYGYELADADWDIEFPDLDNTAEWTEIPPSKSGAAWPPPPGDEPAPRAGLASQGSREPRGSDASGFDNKRSQPAGTVKGGLGVAEASALPRMGASGMMGTPGAAGLPGSGAHTGGYSATSGSGSLGGSVGSGLGDRPLASPGDGRGQVASGRAASPWGRTGQEATDSLDMSELERLGSGEPGSDPVPKDGRLPWRPGQASAGASPSFQPTPPSEFGPSQDESFAGNEPKTQSGKEKSNLAGTAETGGSTHASNASRSSVNTAPSAANRGGSNDAIPGDAIPRLAGGQPPTTTGSGALREAIARRNGLVAPLAPGSSTRTSDGGGQTASTRGGGNSAASAGGVPGGGGSGGGTPGGRGGSGRDPFASQAFAIVVSCDRAGLTIHPGGETLAFEAVSRDDSLFPAKLRALVKAKQDSEPEIGLRPRVKFLVKPGGEVAYLKARWQATSATTYPTTWQLVDRGGPRLPDLETR